jgi:uncharacterized membrane protein
VSRPELLIMTGPAPFLPVTPLIAMHVASGLSAVGAGALAMLSIKGGASHRRAGLAYLAALTLLVISGSALALADVPARRHLLALGVLALLLAALGYGIRLRRRPGWRPYHLLMMGISYIVMLTAFYVDNGPRLPLWWRLPPWALWLLPAVLGVVPLVRAWRRYTTSAS